MKLMAAFGIVAVCPQQNSSGFHGERASRVPEHNLRGDVFQALQEHGDPETGTNEAKNGM